MTETTNGTAQTVGSATSGKETIHKVVAVPIPPERAFALFTERMTAWWPTAQFSVAMYRGAGVRNVVVEPREGGAVYEVAEDGERADWGHVTRWDPPLAFEMEWYPGVATEDASTVVVSFHPEGSSTRVELVHAGLDKRPNGAEMVARYTSGWDVVLAPFVDAAHEATTVG